MINSVDSLLDIYRLVQSERSIPVFTDRDRVWSVAVEVNGHRTIAVVFHTFVTYIKVVTLDPGFGAAAGK